MQMEKRGQKQGEDAVFSDHTFYSSSLSSYITKPVASAWQWRMFHPEQFSAGQGLTVLTLTQPSFGLILRSSPHYFIPPDKTS